VKLPKPIVYISVRYFWDFQRKSACRSCLDLYIQTNGHYSDRLVPIPPLCGDTRIAAIVTDKTQKLQRSSTTRVGSDSIGLKI
jgi:hypothetical protein